LSGVIELATDPGMCTACRACELACNQYHSGSFGTARSSIRIQYDPFSSQLVIVIDDTCDECSDQPQPLCAEACAPGAISVAAR